MIEALIVLAYAGAVIGAAIHAFVHPRGVYWRSAAGIVGVAIVAGLIWQLASPSGAAGLGFLFIWSALVAAAIGLGFAAGIAATVRYALDAWRGAAN